MKKVGSKKSIGSQMKSPVLSPRSSDLKAKELAVAKSPHVPNLNFGIRDSDEDRPE